MCETCEIYQKANVLNPYCSAVFIFIKLNLATSKSWTQTHFNKRNSPKKKVTVIGDSMIKYLRRENLSSKNYEVKIAGHSGSITDHLIDYVKPVVRKKTDYLVIRTERMI